MEAPSASGWAGEGWGREDGRREGVLGREALPRGQWGRGWYPRVPLEFSTPPAPSGLVLSLSPITLVSGCLPPATFQLNHSLKFGAVAKPPLPSNRIFTVSTAAASVAPHLLL